MSIPFPLYDSQNEEKKRFSDRNQPESDSRRGENMTVN